MEDNEIKVDDPASSPISQKDLALICDSITKAISQLKAVKETIFILPDSIKEIDQILSSLPKLDISLTRACEDFDHLLESFVQKAAKAMNPIVAMGKMAKHQFIYWNYLKQRLILGLVETEDVDSFLLNYCLADDYPVLLQTIDKCVSSQYLQNNTTLFQQSIFAYTNGQYAIAAVGFIAIFDSLLMDTSGIITSRVECRKKAIMDILKNDSVIIPEQYSELCFYFTFTRTLSSLTAHAGFTEPEPEGLNRHWIAHGRTRHEYNQLDCIKLIYCIYSLIIVAENSSTCLPSELTR